MRRHNTDEGAWTDETLPIDERIEALRLAMQEWELASGVDRRHVRVVSSEEAEQALMATGSKESQHDAQIALLNERFAGLEGHLFGRDGTNGAFGDLRADIKALTLTVDKMHSDVHAANERYAAELAKADSRIELLKKDINSVGEIARDVRDRGRDTIKRLKVALITIASGAVGAVLWAGVQALI